MEKNFVMPWEERPADCKEVMWRYSKVCRCVPLR